MKTVLLVEDDPSIREPLLERLPRFGFDVKGVGCLQAIETLDLKDIDLIIMDWELPDGEGVDFVKSLRKQGFQIPVIFLTARTDVVDKVIGFEIGGNDYMTKPFEVRELVARMRNQLRVSVEPEATELQSNGIRLDLESRRVYFEDQEVKLSKTEFNLLEFFMENENKALGRDEILNKVWGYDNFPNSRTVDVHVNGLRQKFNADFFESLRGIGYRYVKK